MGERVALVTGGARGIGAAAALALAREDRDVAVADIREAQARDVAAQVQALGRRSLAVALDVTDAGSVAAATRDVEARLGAVDVLVNCAGWDEFHPFLETDEQFWHKVISINLEGALRTTRALLGGMLERGWGRIVNVSSDAARVGSSQEAVYAGAKAGVIAFTKTIAREAAARGVTANVVCPGPTDTGLLSEMAEGASDSQRMLASLTRAVPMRRLGRPEDVAAAIAFFAGEDAGYITGQTLSVSGGLTMA
ncbi:MAG TPA: SDR family oxidoreductase [Solirubrobacteraceae bacterium]|nr:SDR family oxidoreductase [Solirubrobacteraceae bacterium]